MLHILQWTFFTLNNMLHIFQWTLFTLNNMLHILQWTFLHWTICCITSLNYNRFICASSLQQTKPYYNIRITDLVMLGLPLWFYFYFLLHSLQTLCVIMKCIRWLHLYCKDTFIFEEKIFKKLIVMKQFCFKFICWVMNYSVLHRDDILRVIKKSHVSRRMIIEIMYINICTILISKVI